MSIYFVQNEFVESTCAKSSLLDMGFLRGYGIFEFVRTYNRVPFRLGDHLDRFEFSAKKVHIKIPYSRDEIVVLIDSLIEKNIGEEFYIRFVLTPGIAANHLLPGDTPTFAIIVEPVSGCIGQKKKSISLCSIPFQRQFYEVKSLQYMGASLCFQKAIKKGFQDALYLDDEQNFLESTTSNFFGVIDNTIVTPSDKVLSGITRKVVIELASDAGFKVEARQVPYKELEHFSEAFITSTIKEIMPVSKIDDFEFNNNVPGPVTTELMKLFTSLTKKKLTSV